MTDTSSWYARKMAQMRGVQIAPQQPRPQYQQPPQYRYEDHPQSYQQPLPAQQWAPPQPQPEVTMENLYQAMGTWHGGQAHKVDHEPCPQCGSNQYFSRSAGARRGPPPAPHCYNCGYNGLFDQADATTWGAV